MKLRSPRSPRGTYKSSDLFRSVTTASIAQFDTILAVNARLINEKTKDGDTVLHLAGAAGKIDMFKHIATNHPKLLVEKNKVGATALHHAAVKGQEGIVVYVATTYPHLINEKNRKGVTVYGALSRSNIPNKRNIEQCILKVQVLISNQEFAETLASILYAPKCSFFDKLNEDMNLSIVSYLVTTCSRFISEFKVLCAGIANKYLTDNGLTLEDFQANETKAFKDVSSRVSHITAASEFMAGVIMKTYNEDAIIGVLTLEQLPVRQAQLQEWLSSTLIKRGAEFGWLVNKEFRQGIMHVVQKAMLVQSQEVCPRTKPAIEFVLNRCITNWVKRITSAPTEAVEELQIV